MLEEILVRGQIGRSQFSLVAWRGESRIAAQGGHRKLESWASIVRWGSLNGPRDWRHFPTVP